MDEEMRIREIEWFEEECRKEKESKQTRKDDYAP